MIKEKLVIFSDEADTQPVLSLVEKAAEVLAIEGERTQVCVFCSPAECSLEKENLPVVADHKYKELLSEKVRSVTYSISDNRSDVSALNVQHRENSVCFELLHKSFMSRIFIPHTSGFTPEQVLVACAILTLWGVSADRIVETINELLK